MPKLFGGLKDQEMAAAAHNIGWSLLVSNCCRLCPGPPSDPQGAAAAPSDTAHRALTLGEIREKGVTKKRAVIPKFREQTAPTCAKAFGMQAAQT